MYKLNYISPKLFLMCSFWFFTSRPAFQILLKPMNRAHPPVSRSKPFDVTSIPNKQRKKQKTMGSVASKSPAPSRKKKQTSTESSSSGSSRLVADGGLSKGKDIDSFGSRKRQSPRGGNAPKRSASSRAAMKRHQSHRAQYFAAYYASVGGSG